MAAKAARYSQGTRVLPFTNKWVFLDDRESIEPEQLQNQLRNALDAEARLAVIRNIYEEKERSNSRFCIVEKQNSKESIIGRMFKKS